MVTKKIDFFITKFLFPYPYIVIYYTKLVSLNIIVLNIKIVNIKIFPTTLDIILNASGLFYRIFSRYRVGVGVDIAVGYIVRK